MAEVTKPIALDESLNTTETPSRNVADVLAEELSAIASAIGGGGGSGGHTIEGADGTALSQEPTLQFADADVTDDSTNQKTIVDVVRERTQAEYDDMSAADQAKGIIKIKDANAKPLFDTQVRHGDTTVNAILSIIDKASGSGLANSLVYREEITSITAEMWANIADGSFKGLHTGMHYTAPSGRTYWFADADYFFGSGDTEQTNHHFLVIEDEINHTSAQNTTNNTSGGALGGLIYTNVIPTYQNELNTDFDSSHIISQSIIINTGESSWLWGNHDSFLMNARMVIGSELVSIGKYNCGNRSRQLSLFRNMPETIVGKLASDSSRVSWWLDDVGSSKDYVNVYNQVAINMNYATDVYGVRRAFLIG